MVPGRRQSAREGTGPRLSEWPSETQWMRVQVRLRLSSPLASQEASDVPRLTPHCCCSENPNQESMACPSLTSPSRGRSQQAELVLSLPQSLETGEGLRGRCGVSSSKPPPWHWDRRGSPWLPLSLRVWRSLRCTLLWLPAVWESWATPARSSSPSSSLVALGSLQTVRTQYPHSEKWRYILTSPPLTSLTVEG